MHYGYRKTDKEQRLSVFETKLVFFDDLMVLLITVIKVLKFIVTKVILANNGHIANLLLAVRLLKCTLPTFYEHSVY